jgi:hypothetical protein
MSYSSQESDVTTEIRGFTASVFELKAQWELAIITSKSLNLPTAHGIDLQRPFESFQQFIKIAQTSANDARNGALSTFQEIVVGSAEEPTLSVREKREEAVGALRSMDSKNSPKWTGTVKIDSDLTAAINALKAYARSLSAGSHPDAGISLAIDKAAALTEEHLALQEQIKEALKEQSRVDKKLNSLLDAIMLVISLAPGSIMKTLARWLGADSLADGIVSALAKQDEQVQQQLLETNLTIKRLQAAKKRVEGVVAAVEGLVETVSQLSTGFKLTAPRLAQLCVITDNVRRTIETWIAFLDSNEAQNKVLLQAYVEDLKVASEMYVPINTALADFVGRQI